VWVDLLTNSRTPDTTPSPCCGPFYVAGPPDRPHGADIAEGLPGTPLWADVRIGGHPWQSGPGRPVVDVWQSNEDGFYDVQLPIWTVRCCAARFRTDQDGRLTVLTILRPRIRIPADGPVGVMLDAVGRHPFRGPARAFHDRQAWFPHPGDPDFRAGGEYLDSARSSGEDGYRGLPEQPGPTPDAAPWTSGARSISSFTLRSDP